MPTSGRGSRPGAGFTLIELIVVIAILALTVSMATLALRDNRTSRLEEEAERLATLFEMARAEARVAGTPVRWLPRSLAADAGDDDFAFVGISRSLALPTRWLARGIGVEVVGAPFVTLGPEAILPPQRVQLSYEGSRIDVASDGLAPFAAALPP